MVEFSAASFSVIGVVDTIFWVYPGAKNDLLYGISCTFVGKPLAASVLFVIIKVGIST